MFRLEPAQRRREPASVIRWRDFDEREEAEISIGRGGPADRNNA